MTDALKSAIDKVRQLPSREQDQVAGMLNAYVAQYCDSEQFKADMANPAYRAYVEEAVAAGQADIDAGRIMSADQIKRELKHQS